MLEKIIELTNEYIESNADSKKYDFVIENPPYMKISKSAPEAMARPVNINGKDFKTYKRFVEKLAWETEVWIAETPEHMIHLNGDRFMGPT